GFFISYELFDFWARPWLTAWLALGYFAAALLVDVLFPAGTFCRYVCPLGNFNFALASVSPSQITAVDPDVCRSCVEKPCLHGRHSGSAAVAGADTAFIPLDRIVNPNGEGRFPGCETDLFVPTITSNMDCTLCLNCVRACPYDNVGLTVRAPGRELRMSPWARRGRLAVVAMGVLLAFFGVINALAMVPPFYDAAQRLSDLLGTRNEAVLLVTLYGGVTLVGLALTLAAATAADALGGRRAGARAAFARSGYVVHVLGFVCWASHFTVHCLSSAHSIVPVYQHFREHRAFAVVACWRLAQFVPSRSLSALQAVISAAASAPALYPAARIGLREFGRR